MIYIDVLDDDNFIARFDFDAKIVAVMKQLPNRSFEKKIGGWKFPVIDFFIFKKIAAENNVEFEISKKADEKYIEVANKLKELKDISEATDSNHTIHGLKKEVKLYNFQKVGIEFLDKIRNGLMAYDMGLGKFQWVESNVITPQGLRKIGDIRIGDFVIGSDGNRHRVIGVYPQGKQKIYEIEFSDGSKTTSGDDHLWNIQSPNHRKRGSGFVVKKLRDFKNNLKYNNGNSKWFIPMMLSPAVFDGKDLPLNPYLLGALIGDGCLVNGQISITIADEQLLNQVKSLLPNGLTAKDSGDGLSFRISSEKRNGGKPNYLLDVIRELGLDVTSEQKFIPDIYKFSSVESRISILQGLMDTDGGIDTRDGVVITFTSVSEKLVDDLRFIVESLGGTARKSSRVTRYSYNGVKKEGKRSFRINISLPPEILPFRLERKSARYTPRTKYKPYRAITNVKYLGKKESVCISVDSDDRLYATDHCILTHNTIIGISVAANAFKDGTAKKALIITPASLKYEWGYQIAKFTSFPYTIISGKDREKLYKKNTPFIIVNYDLLWRDIEFLKDMEWDLVICDEIQRARNYKTDTVKSLQQLNCKRKIGLTGTPIENDLLDLFTIMKFLDPSLYGKNITPFTGRYCTLDYFGRIDHGRYRNLQEINKKLSFSMIRRRKRDVLTELPEKTINHFYINLSAEEMKKYKEIKSGILEDIESGKIKNIAAIAQVTYLRQVCDALNLVVESKKLSSSKFEELKQIIKDLPKESKIVLFTQYERMAKLIEDNIGYKCVHLHGGVKSECKWENEIEEETIEKNKKMDQKDLDVLVYENKLKAICQNCPYYNDSSKCHTRKKIVSQFNNEEDIKIFISTDAGKAGLNLQTANVVINYDLSFNPAVNEQRIARIDRIGQKSSKILVINFVCVDTIEEKVLRILEKKQKLFDEVIDNLDEAAAMKVVLNKTNIKELL